MNPATEIYYWPRRFVMRSSDFVQGKAYQRITTTLIAATSGQLEVATADRGTVRCEAIVLGPRAKRLALRIAGPVGYLIEAEPLSVEHQGLMQLLAGRPSEVLERPAAERLQAVLAAAPAEPLSDAEAAALHREAIVSVCPLPEAVHCEPRVAGVLRYLEQAMLDEISIAALARQAGLSESRLRSLARKHLGCSLSQYVRWLAAWKIALYWQPEMTLTDAAHAAGFHDLAHASRTVNDMFGMSPSRVLRSDAVRLQPCFEPGAAAGVSYKRPEQDDPGLKA